MIQISLLKIILSFGFMLKQKIFTMNLVHGAAVEPQGRHFESRTAFSPTQRHSVGALVTLHHVGTVPRNHCSTVLFCVQSLTKRDMYFLILIDCIIIFIKISLVGFIIKIIISVMFKFIIFSKEGFFYLV